MDTVRWIPEDEHSLLPGKLRLIDQTKLPGECQYIETDDLEEIFQAIKHLCVRGAPAIGCTAALGLAAVCQHSKATTTVDFIAEMHHHADYLCTSRPTAVNLFWALDRCREYVERAASASSCNCNMLKSELLKCALDILEEDMALCEQIGKSGLELFENTSDKGVLTHCNAGSLAASEHGTALAPIYEAQKAGLAPHVFADETRPLLQGARLTAWELMQQNVDVTLICDNMAAQVMKEGLIDFLLVGADRIATNGDTANKIGTYGIAILARYHQIPMYIAAPYSTIDMALTAGREIPIEQRDSAEITHFANQPIAPQDCKAYCPAFDVTPNELISGIVTEMGILRPPFTESISKFMNATL